MNKYLAVSLIALWLLTSCGPCDKACCVKQSLAFDHIALMCDDVDASATWFINAFQTEEIANQTGNPAIRWLALGEGELHLVPADTTVLTHHKSVHPALKVIDLDAFVARLDSLHIVWEGWRDGPSAITTRPDGVRQVYFKDLNGYWWEVNDAK